MRLPVTVTAEDHRRGGWGGGDGGGDGDEATGEEAGGLGLLPLRSQGFPRSAYGLVVPRLPGTPCQQSRGRRPPACAEGASREYLWCPGARVRGAALV